MTLFLAAMLGTTGGGSPEAKSPPLPKPTNSVSSAAVTVPDQSVNLSAWSAQVKDAASSSSSELERKILADGMITAAEAAEARSAFASCMSAYGMTVEWAGDSDAFSVGVGTHYPNAEELATMGKRQAECSKSTPVTALSLYYQMRRNPQKQDEFTIIAACLVRKGVMPAGYSASDFARDRAMQPPPKPFESDAAGRCMTSPLEP